MKCTKCGAELPLEARFCMMCGAAAEAPKGPIQWADSNVLVTFDSVRATDRAYAFCFRFKNDSGRKILPILYSLTIGGETFIKDRLMQILGGVNQTDEVMQNLHFGGNEIVPDGEVVCYALVSREKCVIDPKNLPLMKCAPAYCLRGEDGYNYGADQHNLPEKEFTI